MCYETGSRDKGRLPHDPFKAIVAPVGSSFFFFGENRRLGGFDLRTPYPETLPGW
jgi:hypothetical protein